ncbi:type II toxin-antitoxin system VapC family toxin [Rhizobium sp. P32RR-XVIII]|uniref:type II toxin-antitoxin system VapC family toxin n=1 Tax=Rhizobium sp. P32RR-XVIII TaxID=2726738 RepID=UPI001456819A|nr:type II toxin-antitoxin system VapC family toxin [Rhizobium sp. P32RR-XVIII]NLS03083.1 type II toxin-antitoxin system VapC family toxin [Rhizobium sp. P32RR-XVIII]
MAFVIDASVAAAWLLPDETNGDAEKALSLLETEDALVPDLFWHEIRNILISAERRKRISGEDILACLMRLDSLPIVTIPGSDHVTIIRLSRAHRLSAYDAAYLALAISEGAPLATLDARLIEAARAEKVALAAG